MNKTMSIYLDLLRFLAAVAVFLHHLPLVTGGGYGPFARYGDDAVMVFFVLSGFVIAHVVETKERDPVNYMASRLARLYSVALPALLLTLILDYVGMRADPSVYAGWYSDSWPLVRMAASLTFTNQLWTEDIRPFSNLPYWSISFEFWYYVFFALLMFSRRWWHFLLWALFVGPCILLLLPVWLAGVLTYRLSQRFHANTATAWLMAVAPLAIYVGYNLLGMREVLTAPTDRIVLALTGNLYLLHKARFFLHDYVLTTLLCIHFLGATSLARTRQWTIGQQLIPIFAAYTFSLYLLHYPLLFCLAALIPLTGPAQDLSITAGVALGTWLVGTVCEQRKGALRRLLLATWNRGHGALARMRQ